MNFRKIIKFGKASYIISLPKEWLVKNNLKRGDHIYVDEIDGNLLLLPKRNSDSKELMSIELDVSKINNREIARKIISAYIKNYNVIHIFGRDLSDKIKGIKDTIQNLMALEIMEETTDRIVAKDLLNMDDISVMDLLRRMDIITRAMFRDHLENIDKSLSENIHDRDADVNRLMYLIYRSLNHYFKYPMLAGEKGLTTRKLIMVGQVTQSIERFADDTKRIAKLMARVTLTNKQKARTKEIMEQVYNFYEGMMKAFYKDDMAKAFSIAHRKGDIIKEIREFYDDVWKIKWASVILEKMKDSVSCVQAIGRSIYN